MKILVTGTSGFIGSQLANSLEKGGHKFIVKIDDEYLKDNWKENLLDILSFNKPDVVFHVGACSDTLEQNVNYMMTRNYETTKLLCDWCKQNNKKIIYSSSAANYGTNGEYPSNLYGWSKYVAEDYVINTGGIALRYFNVYGPGEDKKGRMASFLLQAYKKNKNNEKVFLFPKQPTRDFIYIDDVVSANISAMNNYEIARGKYYEVSTGTSSSFEEMLKLAKIKYNYLPENKIPLGYQFYTRGDSTKWLPGWKPKFNLSLGVTKYTSHLNKEI